ncbi:hypothetical protein C900_04294 [Fulvivirga imtechensis AK7]|uniref:ER-bound oxygenase mpaB/mpaB'/Rubber oxygenase catalytic domain-containing protein n=1 Tax=Fulvivirga imtechensis AK7 TaxID=1237149 RepID=L8K1V7_9BACT|nr:oxygenase MpaB family protein [Fulvivirga imtechensis]ELR73442.1 hypothetical protein C900_04294 [Fulvivirga imtechensis AK7]
MKDTFSLSVLTPDALNNYRLIADPLADDTVAQIITSGYEKEISQVFMTLVQNDSFKADTFSHFESDLAAILSEYFERTSQLPSWADMSMINRGEKLFSIYGPEIFMLLNVSSLPLCYTCAKGARVLFDTGRLLVHNKDMDPLARRLMETAQMIVNVMSSGGLAPEGRGIVTIQKVRLIHAAIRYYLKSGQYKNTPWDVAGLGEPINQEDLAGTLMSFGPVILSGLRHLNIQLTQQESDAYMHCWKVVGYLMGIDEALLPNTYDEGFELATRILKHQAAESDEGKALTQSCIKFINYIMPGNTFDEMPNFLMDFFLKDFSKSSAVDLSKCIGVTSHSDIKDRVVLSLTRYIIGKISHLENSEFIRTITPPFNRLLLQGIIHHLNGGKGVHFSIPPSLQKDWGLTEEWNNYKLITPSILGNRLAWQKKNQKLI